MNQLVTINGVDGFIDSNGVVQLNLENVSRGLGFVQTKNNVEYVRWETVNGYLKEFKFSQQAGKENYIPENIFYRLAMKAKNEIAESFQIKVADDILPSIRKTGSYNLNDPQKLIALALIEAQKVLEAKDEQIAIMQPKAEFFDQVASSKDAIDIGTAAKVLKLPGIGRNLLFERLRGSGVLMTNNQPYQKYVDSGYFRVVEQKFTKPDGSTSINIKTLVYQKGLDFIRRTLIQKEEHPCTQ